MQAGFDPLRKALVQAGMPGISVALALKIFQARQKDGGCNYKANATDSDVAPLIRAGFVRICTNKALDFTRKAVRILDGRLKIPTPATPKRVHGNGGKKPEQPGRMVHPKGKRAIPTNGH